MKQVEKEFIDYSIQVGKIWGLDTLSSRLFGIVYLESKEIAIEDLAKITGYSLASISNKMRFLEVMGVAQRIKKPGSKKVFYFMEKDVVKMTKMHFEKIYESEILPAKTIMPKLINKFKGKKFNKKESEKFKIIKNYYSQILKVEKVFENINKQLDEI